MIPWRWTIAVACLFWNLVLRVGPCWLFCPDSVRHVQARHDFGYKKLTSETPFLAVPEIKKAMGKRIKAIFGEINHGVYAWMHKYWNVHSTHACRIKPHIFLIISRFEMVLLFFGKEFLFSSIKDFPYVRQCFFPFFWQRVFPFSEKGFFLFFEKGFSLFSTNGFTLHRERVIHFFEKGFAHSSRKGFLGLFESANFLFFFF